MQSVGSGHTITGDVVLMPEVFSISYIVLLYSLMMCTYVPIFSKRRPNASVATTSAFSPTGMHSGNFWEITKAPSQDPISVQQLRKIR
ncbi:hypothetical protein BD410DRAFT_784641 [Rickenella mellea]|uniref:Uncharacterized protein n=1 Tax=Rickenella mellea TaxID=50990 RepID=A0A4Y7QFH8_9AGAM|nr:hypothetical protein BD410DRAFT_784641 [Rickenella mellea]